MSCGCLWWGVMSCGCLCGGVGCCERCSSLVRCLPLAGLCRALPWARVRAAPPACVPTAALGIKANTYVAQYGDSCLVRTALGAPAPLCPPLPLGLPCAPCALMPCMGLSVAQPWEGVLPASAKEDCRLPPVVCETRSHSGWCCCSVCCQQEPS